MSHNKALFEYIVHFHTPKQAKLGDDQTTLKIPGYGMMNYTINGHRIWLIGYFVPQLGTTLISIRQHMKYCGCYFHAENNKVTLAYPNVIITPTSSPKFRVKIAPATNSTLPYAFDESTAVRAKDQRHRKFKIIHASKAAHIQASEYPKFARTVKVIKLLQDAKLPHRATAGSIGLMFIPPIRLQYNP